MFLRTLPHQGVPLRGSLPDRVAQALLTRERHKKVSEHAYLGRIIAAGMKLPNSSFQLWTSLLAMEIYQENYSAATLEAKKVALKTLSTAPDTKKATQKRMFDRLNELSMTENELRPITPAERERFKRKLRRRFLSNSSKPKKE